jgi:hypothetical protein
MCRLCEVASERGWIIYYRWGIANIGIVACDEHGKEVIEALNKTQEIGENP